MKFNWWILLLSFVLVIGWQTGMYYLLTSLGMNYVLAASIPFAVFIIAGIILYRYLNKRDKCKYDEE